MALPLRWSKALPFLSPHLVIPTMDLTPHTSSTQNDTPHPHNTTVEHEHAAAPARAALLLARCFRTAPSALRPLLEAVRPRAGRRAAAGPAAAGGGGGGGVASSDSDPDSDSSSEWETASDGEHDAGDGAGDGGAGASGGGSRGGNGRSGGRGGHAGARRRRPRAPRGPQTVADLVLAEYPDALLGLLCQWLTSGTAAAARWATDALAYLEERRLLGRCLAAAAAGIPLPPAAGAAAHAAVPSTVVTRGAFLAAVVAAAAWRAAHEGRGLSGGRLDAADARGGDGASEEVLAARRYGAPYILAGLATVARAALTPRPPPPPSRRGGAGGGGAASLLPSDGAGGAVGEAEREVARALLGRPAAVLAGHPGGADSDLPPAERARRAFGRPGARQHRPGDDVAEALEAYDAALLAAAAGGSGCGGSSSGGGGARGTAFMAALLSASALLEAAPESAPARQYQQQHQLRPRAPPFPFAALWEAVAAAGGAAHEAAPASLASRRAFFGGRRQPLQEAEEARMSRHERAALEEGLKRRALRWAPLLLQSGQSERSAGDEQQPADALPTGASRDQQQQEGGVSVGGGGDALAALAASVARAGEPEFARCMEERMRALRSTRTAGGGVALVVPGAADAAAEGPAATARLPLPMARQCEALAAICDMDDLADCDSQSGAGAGAPPPVLLPPIGGLAPAAAARWLRVAVEFDALRSTALAARAALAASGRLSAVECAAYGLPSHAPGASDREAEAAAAAAALPMDVEAELLACAMDAALGIPATAGAAAAVSSSFAPEITKDDLVEIWLLADFLGYSPLFGPVRHLLARAVGAADGAWAAARLPGHPLSPELLEIWARALPPRWRGASARDRYAARAVAGRTPGAAAAVAVAAADVLGAVLRATRCVS